MSAAGGGDATWVGKKPIRRIGGMADALSLASALGFPALPQPNDEGSDTSRVVDRSDDLVRVLRELTSVQRNLANLQVELQGRKDRIIGRLQQPYSLDCIPVEAEFQRQFSELLLKAASDYGALTASVSDIQWSQNFRDPPTVWSEMLRPIPVALASCTRFFEALTATRDSFSALQTLRVRQTCPVTSVYEAQGQSPAERVTLNPWNATGYTGEEPNSDDLVIQSRRWQDGVFEVSKEEYDATKQRRLSWPSPKNAV